jgi:hypothetical protein
MTDNNNSEPKRSAQITTRQFAYFIVDGLIMANLIKKDDLGRSDDLTI